MMEDGKGGVDKKKGRRGVRKEEERIANELKRREIK